MSERRISSVIWLEISPKWSTYLPKTLIGLRVSKTFARRPKKAAPGTALMRLNLDLPAKAFIPLEVSADLTVPEGALEFSPPEVEVLAP